jgi:arabinogalactan endo-1,4-beta-galactosidase
VNAGPNYVLNGSFEETDGKTLDNWTVDGDQAAKASLKGRTGKYQLGHYSRDAFKVTTYQKVNNLPKGKYTLRGYIQTSGKLNTGYVFVKNYGGKELTTAAPLEKTWWKYFEIKDIEIKNGQCTIGLFTDGNAGNWCGIDDLELIEQP